MKNIPTYRLYGEKTSDFADFWLHCETIPARSRLHNWEITRHRHKAFFQIFRVDRGSGEIIGGTDNRRFDAPCAIFIPPGAVHGFRFSRDVDGLVVTVLADRLASIAAGDRQIARFAEAVRVVSLSPDDQASVRVRDSIGRVSAEIAGHAPARTMLLEALMVTAIIDLAHLDDARSMSDQGRGTPTRRRVEEFAVLVGAHYREQRPLSFYADRLGISPTHLNRLCRAETGESAQGVVARRVTEAARRDLVFTPTPIQAIAFSLGFSDPAYFNRFFRRQTGKTPGAFRREERARMTV